ncbi:hypothetical protein C0J52_11872 [Blattella germanica]|nr:hypothetical protein C0J52_11872 [Blattella germanica]
MDSFIVFQVFYLTPELTNSFIITLQEQDKSKLEDLALCSANGSSNKQTTEVSCFTSLVRFLNTTDRIFLRQRERKRRIILREGHSFLGVVLLNGKKSSR